MERLSELSPVPSFQADTLEGGRLGSDDISVGTVHLAFHRYAACPVYSSKIAEFRVRLGELETTRHVAVFHSPVEKMRRYFPEDLPFTVLCDPEMELYRAFGVTTSVVRMMDPRSIMAAISGRKEARGPHDVDGPATMVPADFLLVNGRLVRAHYGRHLGDGWSVPRLLEELESQGLRAPSTAQPATMTP